MSEAAVFIPGPVLDKGHGACSVCGAAGVVTFRAFVWREGSDPQRIPDSAYCSDSCRDQRDRELEWVGAERDMDERLERYRWEYDRRTEAYRHVWPRYRGKITPDSLIPELAELPADTSVVISGPTGTGKTHQAWAWWVRWALYVQNATRTPYGVLGECPKPVFYTAPDLLERIRRSYDGNPFSVDRGALLVIDDLGVERPTEWVMEQLYRLIDERYREYAPLVVTTNLGGRELRDRLGDRLVSRLVEACYAVRVDGRDRRLGVGA